MGFKRGKGETWRLGDVQVFARDGDGDGVAAHDIHERHEAEEEKDVGAGPGDDEKLDDEADEHQHGEEVLQGGVLGGAGGLQDFDEEQGESAGDHDFIPTDAPGRAGDEGGTPQRLLWQEPEVVPHGEGEIVGQQGEREHRNAANDAGSGWYGEVAEGIHGQRWEIREQGTRMRADEGRDGRP